MTNWDKFDVDKALNDIDVQEERKEKLKNGTLISKQQEKALAEAQRKAEILETKVTLL